LENLKIHESLCVREGQSKRTGAVYIQFTVREGQKARSRGQGLFSPHSHDYFAGKKKVMGNVIQSKAAQPTTPAAKLGHLLAKQFNYAIFTCGHKQ